MLNSLQTLPPGLAVVMLKCIKNISMNSNTLDVLQTASAIHTLVQVLGERAGPHATVNINIDIDGFGGTMTHFRAMLTVVPIFFTRTSAIMS